MKIIILTGILAYEKAQFAARLAEVWREDGLTVTIIEDDFAAATLPINRIHDGLTLQGNEPLYNKVQRMAQDILLLIAAEQAHPEVIVDALDKLQAAQPDSSIQIIALIDNRTCDCFPHLREILENTADLTLYAPFELKEALRRL